MTDARKAELEAIHDQKVTSGTRIADSIVETLLALQSEIDPSVFYESIVRLGERLHGLEREVADATDNYEKATYGVNLSDIEGRWDEPFEVLDMRTPPVDLPL